MRADSVSQPNQCELVVCSTFLPPADQGCSDENPDNWDPSDSKICADAEVDAEVLQNKGWEGEEFYSDEEEGEERLIEAKWMAVRKPVLPEPFFEDVDYSLKSGERLSDKFHDSGLQVIVKMASIELTPEKPQFPHGSWHVEGMQICYFALNTLNLTEHYQGQLNENICATALYYLDSENITDSSLSFQMQTSAYLTDENEFSVGQDAYHWMESLYCTFLGSMGGACIQKYGTVQTKAKRLLAFPNVL